jgi:bacterioferritin-associated ferredoxin
MAEEKRDAVSFTELIDQLDMGQCSAECNRALREVIAKCAEIASENGKASGSLTLTLKFSTAGQSGQTDIECTVNGKPPTRPTAKTVLYATAKGGLTAQDPRQKKFQWANSPAKSANTTAGSDAE